MPQSHGSNPHSSYTPPPSGHLSVCKMATEPRGHCFSPVGFHNQAFTFMHSYTRSRIQAANQMKPLNLKVRSTIALEISVVQRLRVTPKCRTHTLRLITFVMTGVFLREVKTAVSPHQVVCFLGTRVSGVGRRKDGGQQGQTRQPLRSHQVCRDTLEHSEPDGICPPGLQSRPDDIQTQGQAKKEGRIEDSTSCL